MNKNSIITFFLRIYSLTFDPFEPLQKVLLMNISLCMPDVPVGDAAAAYQDIARQGLKYSTI